MSENSNIISIFEGQEKKKKEGSSEKGGENSPISPPLDPRLRPLSKMAAENSNKLKLANIKNVCQHKKEHFCFSDTAGKVSAFQV